MKRDHIKRLITLNSDYIKRLLLYKKWVKCFKFLSKSPLSKRQGHFRHERRPRGEPRPCEVWAIELEPLEPDPQVARIRRASKRHLAWGSGYLYGSRDVIATSKASCRALSIVTKKSK